MAARKPVVLVGGNLNELATNDYLGVASLAIAEGATTPDPGITGVLVYSSTTARLMEWSGTAWKTHTRTYVGTSAPSNPAVGDLWVDTN